MAKGTERYLPTDAELYRAVMWRLSGFSDDEVNALVAVLHAHLGGGGWINEDDRVIAGLMECLRRPGNKRDPWTALLAIAYLAAEQADNLRLVYLAGSEVYRSYLAAGHRERAKSAPSLLNSRIEEFIAACPEATAFECFESLCQEASAADGDHELWDAAEHDDVLGFRERGQDGLTLGFDSFRRRFSRVRKIILT